jgi:starvation-inducible DNA-binding protein
MIPPQLTIEDSPAMYETENDLSQSRRFELNALLNLRLASAVDLQLQLKQAHWNVKGPNFIGLHELFDKVNAAVAGYVDLIAERVAQLGGIAEGTVRVAAARTRLPEYPLSIAEGPAHVEAVARGLSLFGREARDTIEEANALGDAVTAPLMPSAVYGAPNTGNVNDPDTYLFEDGLQRWPTGTWNSQIRPDRIVVTFADASGNLLLAPLRVGWTFQNILRWGGFIGGVSLTSDETQLLRDYNAAYSLRAVPTVRLSSITIRERDAYAT